MAKNIFDSLSPAAAFATKLFSAAGLDFAAMAASGNESALKDHLASLSTAAGVKEAIEQATARLTADLTASQSDLTASQAELSRLTDQCQQAQTALNGQKTLVLGYETALANAGVKPQVSDAKVGLQITDITSAIDSRIKTRAGEFLAEHGLKNFPEQQVSGDPGAAPKQTAKSELKGLAKVRAAFAAQA